MSFLSTSGKDPNNLGYFATPAALTAAFPVGFVGAFALVGSTDTIWVWDDGTNAWVNTGSGGGGSGTVTTVSVVTANGVSGSVANPTTTPAITITLAAITPISVNGLVITTTTGTLTLANGKTVTVNNSITLAGTDGSVMTFPTTSATIARTDAAQTFTGAQTFSSSIQATGGIKITNASTVGFVWTATDTAGNGSWQASPAGFADPLTTNGDIIARIAGATTRLAQGSNGQFLGVSGGVLGYYTPGGGGSPGGSNTQLQYNNAGAFGGITDATTNGTTLTLASLVLNALPTGTGVASAPTASTVVTRNISANLFANNVITGLQSIATAGGTTTLTVASPKETVFTGTLAQTCVMPDATTLTLGQIFHINNQSTGFVTVNANGGGGLWVMAPNTDLYLLVTSIGTAAGTYELDYQGSIVVSGKRLIVNNSLTFSGTDSTVLTFPTTSATIARTDAAQTFTGVQSMTSPAITTGITAVGTSFALVNTVATTVNIAGAATTLTLGASTGTLTIGNVTIAATNATSLALNGASPSITTTSTATASVFNTNALIGNLFGAATTLTIGGTPTGAVTHNYSTNATASTFTKVVNIATGGVAGSTTNINIGSNSGGTTNILSPNVQANGVAIPTISSTSTFTNKRVQPRTASSTTSSNLSPDLSTANVYFRTTQTATLTIDAPTGTPVIGETIMIYVDSVAAQTLTINATYISFGAAFPATTTAGKTFMMSAQFNGTNWKTLWSNQV